MEGCSNMQAQDPVMNNIYDVPDDTTPEELAAIQTSVQRQAQQRQSLMAGLGSMGQTLMQAVTPQQHFPVISPAGAASMTPQAFQQFVGQQQESIERGKDREYQGQRDQARMSLEERVMTQRALEAEKDRAQLLKVEQARAKNAETIRKMQEDSEVQKAEIKAKEKDEAAKRPKVMGVAGGAYQFTPGESGFETKMLVPPKAKSEPAPRQGWVGDQWQNLVPGVTERPDTGMTSVEITRMQKDMELGFTPEAARQRQIDLRNGKVEGLPDEVKVVIRDKDIAEEYQKLVQKHYAQNATDPTQEEMDEYLKAATTIVDSGKSSMSRVWADALSYLESKLPKIPTPGTFDTPPPPGSIVGSQGGSNKALPPTARRVRSRSTGKMGWFNPDTNEFRED